MKPSDIDYTKIFKVVFHQVKGAGGFMNNDHVSGLGNSAKPKSYRYNSSVRPVLVGSGSVYDMNTFTKESDPTAGSVGELSIDFDESDFDDQDNSFVTGVGYINWAHDGWEYASDINDKQNKICWLGTRADDAIAVTIDGERVAATKYLGSESVSGTGDDDVFHMFTARGEISAIEIKYVARTGSNGVELDFGVVGAFD
jgi:hypothetical protein